MIKTLEDMKYFSDFVPVYEWGPGCLYDEFESYLEALEKHTTFTLWYTRNFYESLEDFVLMNGVSLDDKKAIKDLFFKFDKAYKG